MTSEVGLQSNLPELSALHEAPQKANFLAMLDSEVDLPEAAQPTAIQTILKRYDLTFPLVPPTDDCDLTLP